MGRQAWSWTWSSQQMASQYWCTMRLWTGPPTVRDHSARWDCPSWVNWTQLLSIDSGKKERRIYLRMHVQARRQMSRHWFLFYFLRIYCSWCFRFRMIQVLIQYQYVWTEVTARKYFVPFPPVFLLLSGWKTSETAVLRCIYIFH